tara:strand:- start:1393 stop:1740 length:348 start_codon:yes stop_codon:yes gene_type:complete
MELDQARKVLSSATKEQVEKIFPLAVKAAGLAKSKTYTEKSVGIYNAVGLPDVPARLVSVKDAAKEPPVFGLTGQQVISSRIFQPPVTIEYVTVGDEAAHDAKIRGELEKLRPKS